MRIGQGLLRPAQLSPKPAALFYFISAFHSYHLSIFATAKLPHPTHHGVGSSDAILSLHGPGTILTRFHFPHRLHFEGGTITNNFHDTSEFLIPRYQSIPGRDRALHLPSPISYLPSSIS